MSGRNPMRNSASISGNHLWKKSRVYTCRGPVKNSCRNPGRNFDPRNNSRKSRKEYRKNLWEQIRKNFRMESREKLLKKSRNGKTPAKLQGKKTLDKFKEELLLGRILWETAKGCKEAIAIEIQRGIPEEIQGRTLDSISGEILRVIAECILDANLCFTIFLTIAATIIRVSALRLACIR